MKLRNKLEYIGEEKPKGRVGTLIGYSDSHKAIVVEFEGEDGGIITTFYRSLAELNAEWEDYTSQEPLIKDKNIRKAVSFTFMLGESIFIEKGEGFIRFVNKNSELVFYGRYDEPKLSHKTYYTIAELCGEEE